MAEHSEGLSPLATGLKGRCPRCGEGHLFTGSSRSPKLRCLRLDFSFADSGDGPAVLIMFPVGTIVVAGWLITDALFGWPAVAQLAIWLPMTLILSLLMLRPFKGAMITCSTRPARGPAANWANGTTPRVRSEKVADFFGSTTRPGGNTECGQKRLQTFSMRPHDQ